MSWLDGITGSMDMSLSKLWGLVMAGDAGLVCCSPSGPKELPSPQCRWSLEIETEFSSEAEESFPL